MKINFRASVAVFLFFLSVFAFGFILRYAVAQESQTTLDADDEFCREAIPSIALRHLRTSRFTHFDAVNDQISTRYSEFLDPTFGGYAINDEISSIVDLPSSMSWSSLSYAAGGRGFSVCDSGTSVLNFTLGYDTWLSSQKNFLAGIAGSFNATALNVDNHPIPNTGATSSTETNGQSLIGGLYASYMNRNFHVSTIVGLHNNDLTVSPDGVNTDNQLPSQFGFSSQTGIAFNVGQNSIRHQIGAYISYENLNLDVTYLTAQNNGQINYEEIDLSTIVPNVRWQASSYFVTADPGEFIGIKGVMNARRVYPLGPTSWAFQNTTNGSRGTVSLDSEWTELALDGTISLRSINAREMYASFGYKAVFGEHATQNLGGSDFNIKIGIQFLF